MCHCPYYTISIVLSKTWPYKILFQILLSPILKMRQLWITEVKWLARGHTTNTGLSVQSQVVSDTKAHPSSVPQFYMAALLEHFPVRYFLENKWSVITWNIKDCFSRYYIIRGTCWKTFTLLYSFFPSLKMLHRHDLMLELLARKSSACTSKCTHLGAPTMQLFCLFSCPEALSPAELELS